MEIPVFSSNTGASIYGCPTEGREKDSVMSKGEKEQHMFQRDGNPPVHSKISAMSKFSMRNSNLGGWGLGGIEVIKSYVKKILKPSLLVTHLVSI